MPNVDSLCFIKLTLPSFPRLCWLDTLQIWTTTSHRSFAVRLLSLGPGSSLIVAAKSCPSCNTKNKQKIHKRSSVMPHMWVLLLRHKSKMDNCPSTPSSYSMLCLLPKNWESQTLLSADRSGSAQERNLWS